MTVQNQGEQETTWEKQRYWERAAWVEQNRCSHQSWDHERAPLVTRSEWGCYREWPSYWVPAAHPCRGCALWTAGFFLSWPFSASKHHDTSHCRNWDKLHPPAFAVHLHRIPAESLSKESNFKIPSDFHVISICLLCLVFRNFIDGSYLQFSVDKQLVRFWSNSFTCTTSFRLGSWLVILLLLYAAQSCGSTSMAEYTDVPQMQCPLLVMAGI